MHGHPEELSISKVDPELGRRVQDHLRSLGLSTPTVVAEGGTGGGSDAQIAEIEGHFREIMKVLHLDLDNDSLASTPRRVARMYVNEMFWGLDPDYFPKCTAVDNAMQYDSMVVEKNINFYSYCEHHFVPIEGLAHVAYIPDAKVIGLSKLNRVVQYFSRRPQIQERLTEQVWATLAYILETENVAVSITATHHCVRGRGVRDHASSTVTSKLGGDFRDDEKTRNEYMAVVTSRY